MRVAVTGSSGKIGVTAIEALTTAGHEVLALDTKPSPDGHPTVAVDCTDFGAVMGALSGVDTMPGQVDAVVHLAGIPMPALSTDDATFRTNTLAAYNVTTAVARLGIARLVLASSETLHGLPFDADPAFVPINESHPVRPRWSYALAKQVSETVADAVTDWNHELSVVSLRFSNVVAPDEYATEAHDAEADQTRRVNLWSYIDSRDAGAACRAAVEANLTGHHRLIAAAADTFSATPTAELLHRFFPKVPVRGAITGHMSLLSSAAAAAAIGYRPQHSWREEIASTSSTTTTD